MTKGIKDELDAIIGMRVRQARMRVSVSQEKLGEKLGLTFQQVQKYEKGANRIGCGRLIRIAGILQIPVCYFFEGLENGVPAELPPQLQISQEAHELAQAFDQIGSKPVRKSISDLARNLSAAAST